MSLGGGDKLASGGVRAQFPPSNVTQEKWEQIFGKPEEPSKQSEVHEGVPTHYVGGVSEQTTNIQEPIELNRVEFRAIQDRVIVKRVEEETKTDAGLYIPDENREKPAEGIVVAVGPGKYVNGELQRVNIQVGERVVFGKYSGAEVKLGVEVYLILREEDIFLVREN